MPIEFWLLIAGITCVVIEIGLFAWVAYVRKKFQWLITSRYDERPVLSEEGLKKFIPEGYDPDIGWTRKPNTAREERGRSGTTRWSINERGSRTNPGFEGRPFSISCYGDSFTFCRQVNDDETWGHFLSKLEDTNVLNFGVGNYGVDQSLLRLKKEFDKNKTDVVILAVVPDTISRILSSWKHYYEYGNTFAFKPRFVVKDNELLLIGNKINNEAKFLNYEEYLQEIRKDDFFYENKFKKEIIHFPYIYTILRNFRRNIPIMYWVSRIELFKRLDRNISKIEWNPMQIIMDINLKWRTRLYRNRDARDILWRILEEYAKYAKRNDFTPVFAFLPQKDDINFIRKNFNFYQEFEDGLSSIKGLHVIPVTKHLVSEEGIDGMYSDENEYGGHFSKTGNQKVAAIIHQYLRKIRN